MEKCHYPNKNGILKLKNTGFLRIIMVKNKKPLSTGFRVLLAIVAIGIPLVFITSLLSDLPSSISNPMPLYGCHDQSSFKIYDSNSRTTLSRYREMLDEKNISSVDGKFAATGGNVSYINKTIKLQGIIIPLSDKKKQEFEKITNLTRWNLTGIDYKIREIDNPCFPPHNFILFKPTEDFELPQEYPSKKFIYEIEGVYGCTITASRHCVDPYITSTKAEKLIGEGEIGGTIW